MITVSNIHIDSETGYLGNKMFMLANALAVATRVGDEVVLPRWEFQNTFRKNVSVSDQIKPKFVYSEPHFHYAPVPLSRDLNLLGYFQSEQYFGDCTSYIKEMFTPNETLDRAIMEKFGKALQGETIGIHVRRGDYVKLADHHPFPGLEYYQQALNILPRASKYIIVSNDIAWCKEIFVGEQFVFSESPQEKEQGNSSATFDLFLMSKCSHQVICNSTFSWWASYLNPNPNKIVVAPKTWFGPAKIEAGFDARDVYLKSWTVI